VLSGAQMGADFICAWPGAELGFMDPAVAANVVYKRQLDELDGEARDAEQARLVGELTASADPYQAAGVLTIDEIIDPADTGPVVAARLRQLEGRRFRPPEERPLAGWPMCW